MFAKKALAAALGVTAEPSYVEDVFSTYLYTGNGSNQDIKNGIALGGYAENGTVLQLTGDSIADVSPIPKTLTNSSVSVNTSTKKYGTGSLYLNGSAQLSAPSGYDFHLENENFTLEAWVNPASPGGSYGVIVSKYAASFQDSFWLTRETNRTIRVGMSFSTGGYLEIYSSSTISDNVWSHIAAVRNGNTVTLYINGVSEGTGTATGPLKVTTANVVVGNFDGYSQYFTGYIDDLRITKGVARYTAAFTPPTAALPLDTLVEGKGGMVWIKTRNVSDNNHVTDTVRGKGYYVSTNTTGAQAGGGGTTTLSAFNSNGFSLGSAGGFNGSGETLVSWSFRKAEKFFDVVTWTGNGVDGRQIAHNLGVVPGCIIVKCTSNAETWLVWHRSFSSRTNLLQLNTTNSVYTDTRLNTNALPTSTYFEVGTDGEVNASGRTYVAYLFAHDAGGFGEAGDQSVIKCGSFTGGSDVTIDLGWEPQWVLTKASSTSQNWVIHDNMRGYTATATGQATLHPNVSDAEDTGVDAALTSTGFRSINSSSGATYIYIAIRRGPMKTPESGTEVFDVDTTRYNPASLPSWRSNFPVDLAFIKDRTTTGNWGWGDRLRGTGRLYSNAADAETTNSSYTWDFMNGWASITSADSNNPAWMFRRAPGFFDVVCYTGTGSNRTVSHNLGVAPELMIVKSRSNSSTDWLTYSKTLGNTKGFDFNGTGGIATSSSYWNNTSPTSSVFTVSTDDKVNWNTWTYVAYLFATVPGVSKVDSYTGTGSTLQINCGFTAGARFVLIKRVDTNGYNWYVWDTARGIVSGNDPYLLTNSTAAEVTNTDYIDPYSSGFEISSTAPAGINGSGGTFIYLAIA